MPAIPFDQQEYWSQRFENEQSFEWLMPWSVLEPHMHALNLLPTDPSAKILNLGCGNSSLPLDLYRSGHQHVTSVDFVGSVVKRMKDHCEQAIGWRNDTGGQSGASSTDTSTSGTESKSEPGSATVTTRISPSLTDKQQQCPLQFLEMDCLDMSSLPENSFQLCIDKSTSDAISCGDDDDCTKLRTLCEQVARVITKPGGLWCVISYSRFRQYEWTEGNLGQGLWRTEKIVEIKVEQPSVPTIADKLNIEASGEDTLKKDRKSARIEPRHLVHVPDVFQYLYVNRRL